MSNVILKTINFKSMDEIGKSYNIMDFSKNSSSSIIYKYSNSEVMKIFKTKPTEVHKKILEDFLYHINTETFIKPKNFILLNYCVNGYIMNYCKGRTLSNLDDGIRLTDFFNSFSIIDSDIKTISKRNIYMEDINSNNIIYNKENSKLSVLDFDNYRYMEMDRDALYIRNLSETLSSIIFSFITSYNSNSVGDFSREIIENGYSIKDALYYIKKHIEKIREQEIHTVGDLKENSALLLKLK